MDSSVNMVDDDLFIVTENVCGKIYSMDIMTGDCDEQ